MDILFFVSRILGLNAINCSWEGMLATLCMLSVDPTNDEEISNKFVGTQRTVKFRQACTVGTSILPVTGGIFRVSLENRKQILKLEY
jgi:hypothetical protein